MPIGVNPSPWLRKKRREHQADDDAAPVGPAVDLWIPITRQIEKVDRPQLHPQWRGHALGKASGWPANRVNESGDTKMMAPTMRFNRMLIRRRNL